MLISCAKLQFPRPTESDNPQTVLLEYILNVTFKQQNYIALIQVI